MCECLSGWQFVVVIVVKSMRLTGVVRLMGGVWSGEWW